MLCKRLASTFFVVAAMLGLLAPAIPAVAFGGGSGVVIDSASAEYWSGKLQATSPRVKDVPECQNTGCDTVNLKVDLPHKLEGKPGGVHVKLQLVGATPDDSVGLVIYNHKKQIVAHSSAQVGPARSVLLPSTDGRYTAYVYYNPMERELGSTKLTYEAYVRFEDKPTYPGPVRDLLPDLQALEQRYVTFQSPATFFDDTVSALYPSCFKSEADAGAKLCFRFGQAMANIGQGPMDVRYSTPPGALPEEVDGYQRIYRTDGTYYELQSVGKMHYHPIHSHYHFEDFAVSELWEVDSEGNLVGSAPMASGRKNGFCAADTELFWWSANGPKAAVQSYPAPRCLEAQSVDPDGTKRFKHGISSGWADEYWWALPDQEIDVYGLPDGEYALVTKVDPADKIRETNDGNNCNMVIVQMRGLKTSTPTAAMVANSSRSCAK